MIEDEKTRIVESIKEKYGEGYNDLKWINDEEAKNAETERIEILEYLKNHISFACNGTKPYYIDISPGCRHCGEGTWSCLFINGKCNGHCFFCPSEQTEIGEPVTNSLPFTLPVDYIDYLDYFKMKGVSISGGEPLLTPERTLKFLTAVKNRYGNDIHKWMYTNGILITKEMLQKLRDAGLNEIRINLVAQNYNIEKISLASKYINTVTVEIPAIPEDYERLCGILNQLLESGLKYLNLHQLRCTEFNYKNFIKRGYSFLHGPDVTVLESELTALKLIKFAADSGTKLPINYCSFVYRNIFQRMRARQRSAPCLVKSYEDITETGIIRNLSVKIPKEEADRIKSAINAAGEPETSVQYDARSLKFSFSGKILKYIGFKTPVTVSYHDSTLASSISYRNVFKEIRLNAGKKITAERWRALPEIEVSGEDLIIFKERYLDKIHLNRRTPVSDKLAKIDSMESPHCGLKGYW